MKYPRESTQMKPSHWAALHQLALQTGSTFNGSPSWRTLLRRVATGELTLTVRQSAKSVTMEDEMF